MKYTGYDRNVWLKPLWNTYEVCNETVLFVGEEDEAPLLYRPSEIISVRNYGLDIEYVQGKDYTLTGEGRLKRLPSSAIPFFTREEYYRKEPDSVPVRIESDDLGRKFPENRFAKYGERDTFTSRQVAVTYRHDDRWRGAVPKGKKEKFSHFFNKLANGENPAVVFYGDSITAGCNSSGTEYGGKTAPYAEPWTRMVTEYLKEKFSRPIKYVNTAEGGKTTGWGAENLSERVLSHAPALVVLAFGMNDPDLTVNEYKKSIAQMLDKIRAAYADCGIVLVSTTVPNVESDWFNGMQKKYVTGLKELESEKRYSSFVALADMTGMHMDLLRAGKRFRDMTGNNVNHPNDFLARCYAQVILTTLLGDDFTI